MEIKTHKKINQHLCGFPIEIKDGKFAIVKLETMENMAADEKGLVHGGFIFGAADYCAMLTINDPNVVLGKSEVKFLKPTKVGESIIFKSKVIEKQGKKWKIEISGFNEKNELSFTGVFYCIVPDKHVLD